MSTGLDRFRFANRNAKKFLRAPKLGEPCIDCTVGLTDDRKGWRCMPCYRAYNAANQRQYYERRHEGEPSRPRRLRSANGTDAGHWNAKTREEAQRAVNNASCSTAPFSAYLEVLNTGERFYPETPKPLPERIGAVAKRVRKERSFQPDEDFVTMPRADAERLLACSEASDEYERGIIVKPPAWRRTVTGEQL